MISLEVTSDHLSYAERNGLISVGLAVNIVGDIFSKKTVTLIRKEVRWGVYTPLTYSGDITVSGIHSSNYIDIIKSKNVLLFNQNVLAHMSFFPQHLSCMNFVDACKKESYTDG
jgi:Hint module